MLIGNPFRSEPLPISVQEVSVISTDQFNALVAAQQSPAVETEVALPQDSATEVETPPTPQTEPAQQTPETPEVAEPAEPEPVPEPPEPVVAAPVEDTAPVIEPPSDDVAVLAPEPSETPAPQQADRVAPEPVAQPEPDAAPGDIEQDSVDQSEEGAVEQPEQDATAPEETTTVLTTEADDAGGAPAQSVRPPSRRPTRPVETAQAPVPETAPEPTPTPSAEPKAEPDTIADDIAAAVADAQSETPAPSGPPLTGGEVEGLRVAVANCWNVGTLSTEAQDTSVVVSVAMNQDGTPRRDTIAMASFSGGSESAARRVFETARRAIIRCGTDGFPLPVEKYGQWQNIEMTFKPEGVFWR